MISDDSYICVLKRFSFWSHKTIRVINPSQWVTQIHIHYTYYWKNDKQKAALVAFGGVWSWLSMFEIVDCWFPLHLPAATTLTNYCDRCWQRAFYDQRFTTVGRRPIFIYDINWNRVPFLGSENSIKGGQIFKTGISFCSTIKCASEIKWKKYREFHTRINHV